MTLALKLPSESIFNACSHYLGHGSCRGGLAAGQPQLAQGSPGGQGHTAVISGDSQRLQGMHSDFGGTHSNCRGTHSNCGGLNDCRGCAAIAGDLQRLRGTQRLQGTCSDCGETRSDCGGT